MSHNRRNCNISKRNNTVCSKSEGVYLQTSEFNSREYMLYRDWIISLALNRYRWVNLPETCDERYLERQLLFNGVATISTPDLNSNFFYSLKAVTNGTKNMYGEPTFWDSIGENGYRYKTTPQTGVLVYDNRLRVPKFNAIELFARQLANFDRTLQSNLNAQKTPVVFIGNQTLQQQVTQLYMMYENGEPAFIGTEGLKNLIDEIQALNLNVEFIAEKLQTAKASFWSEIFDYLGIDSLPRKSERMIEDEVNANNEPTKIAALDGLTARRFAANTFNERFGYNVQVVFNHDNESENYNLTHNIKDFVDVMGGNVNNDYSTL